MPWNNSDVCEVQQPSVHVHLRRIAMWAWTHDKRVRDNMLTWTGGCCTRMYVWTDCTHARTCAYQCYTRAHTVPTTWSHGYLEWFYLHRPTHTPGVQWAAASVFSLLLKVGARGVNTKDTTKISASFSKLDAATSKQTTKHSQGTAQYSKKKQKLSRSKQKNAYPDYRPYENFSDWIKILN